MTTPSLPPRPSGGRSSFAIAMKDYTFIRPGIAVSISAATLALALLIGFWLIVSLRGAAATVETGARTVETLHRYNAGLEVWREMVTSTDPTYRRPEALALRDSIGRRLREELAQLGTEMADASDRARVSQVLEGLTRSDPHIGAEARQAMIVLLAKQDSAMFRAAQISQNAVLVIPMAWLYIRYKRGATIEVKV